MPTPSQLAYKPVAYRLPQELWGEIIASCPVPDQLSLSLVNKSLQLLSIRYVYRTVVLESPRSVVTFCRTVTNKKSIAPWVKSLEISYLPRPLSGSNKPLSSFYRLVAKAFQRLSNLLSLRIAASQEYTEVLRDCHFNYLRRFKTTLDFCPLLVLFISRHTALTDLAIEVQLHHFFVQRSLTSLHLQSLRFLKPLTNLQYYRGRSELLPYLVQSQVPLRMVHLELNHDSLKAVDATLTALQTYAGDTLEVLGCYIDASWSLDLLDAISKKLPNIEILTYCNLVGSNANQHAEVYNAFTKCVANFNRLKSFFLIQPGPFDYSHMDRAALNREFKTMVSWGVRCPSLSFVTLPNGMQWTQDPSCTYLWIPHGEALTCNPQIVHWLLSVLAKKPDSLTSRTLLRHCRNISSSWSSSSSSIPSSSSSLSLSLSTSTSWPYGSGSGFGYHQQPRQQLQLQQGGRRRLYKRTTDSFRKDLLDLNGNRAGVNVNVDVDVNVDAHADVDVDVKDDLTNSNSNLYAKNVQPAEIKRISLVEAGPGGRGLLQRGLSDWLQAPTPDEELLEMIPDRYVGF
ncbi:hypothetical protein K435DRAFT_856321 [Dendrothele bispora CBS 962.96]|uniref:F-box domain-containing protein n=1 Tax=Dendrothele bispora (strain CBS 962.96) TaxID=1314807 RepID=A0A4S8MA42_DENBC|nr:hypothetical protein K435DRAFT_856321 [Dendrothele bispora CBS 962.96]